MNIIQIIGNVGADPVARVTAAGNKVVSFNIAVNTKKNDPTGTVWYRVNIWGDKFDKMLPYIKKGTTLFVLGDLMPPTIWTNKNNEKQVQMDIKADVLKFTNTGSSEKKENPTGPSVFEDVQTQGKGNMKVEQENLPF